MKDFIKSRGIAILLLMTLFSLSVSTEAFTQKKKKKKGEASELQQKKDGGNTIALFVSGTGATKEMATTNALRSALEQAYGTFVSANTQVINDKLIRDEIVSISSGNIHEYKEVSCTDLPSGGYEISLRAVVSIDKLVSFAQNHGMSTELSGQTFLMNRKIALLNKENETRAILHLIDKLYEISRKGLFDFSIKVGQPRDYKDSLFCVPVKVYLEPNKNMDIFFQTIDETLSSLEVSDAEGEKIHELGMGTYENVFFMDNNGRHTRYDRIRSFDRNRVMVTKMEGVEYIRSYIFRKNYSYYYNFVDYIMKYSMYCYAVYDNMGTNITPCVIKTKKVENCISELKKLSFERFYLEHTPFKWGGTTLKDEFWILEPLITTAHKPIVANPEQIAGQQYADGSYRRYYHKFDIIYTYEQISRLQNISIKPYFHIPIYDYDKRKEFIDKCIKINYFKYRQFKNL